MTESGDSASSTLAACMSVLNQNLFSVTVNGVEYKRTVPSKEFYVHQWNWDSATHALGLVHWSHERAIEELLALTAGQWANGLVPQIVFNPKETKYFPGAAFWKTEHCSPNGIRTSGITQPPVLAISVPYVFRSIADSHGGILPDKEREQIALLLQRTFLFLQYLKRYRDREECGLITIIHPWESGLDNSPNWDEGISASEFDLDTIPEHVVSLVTEHRKDVVGNGANVAERPEQKKYFDYMMLVDCFNKLGWDSERIVSQSPFQVKDVLFTSVFAAGCEALAELLKSELAEKNNLLHLERSNQLYEWLSQAREGLRNCWDDGLGGYLCQNCRVPDANSTTGYANIKIDTITKFMPLLAGVPSAEVLTILLNDLADPETYGTKFPVPSTSLSARDVKGKSLFEMSRYWRGPTWPITNLLLAEGLTRYALKHPGAKSRRDIIVSSTLSLAEVVGLREYYHPVEGEKENEQIGFGNFSWTAAIYIYLTEKYKNLNRINGYC